MKEIHKRNYGPQKKKKTKLNGKIPISTCHICDKERWEPGKGAVGTYKCSNCGRIIKIVLSTKEREVIEDE